MVSEAIGEPVIVEDRPGASSIIGMEACAKAKSDGQTLCLTVADSLSYNPQLFANLPYDPDKSFAPIVRLGVDQQSCWSPTARRRSTPTRR